MCFSAPSGKGRGEVAGTGGIAIPLILTVLLKLAASVMAAVMAGVMAGITPASAHSGGDVAQGFVGGFLHPLTGPDHVAAMVAVGLWGAVLGPPALWLLPVAFPLVMALGTVGCPRV